MPSRVWRPFWSAHALNGGADGLVCPDMAEREHGELSEAHGFAIEGVGKVDDEFTNWKECSGDEDGLCRPNLEVIARYDDFIRISWLTSVRLLEIYGR